MTEIMRLSVMREPKEDNGPTKWRMRQGDVAIDEGDRGGVQIRSFAFPLDFYLRRKHISERQWTAGDKLHELWWLGCASSAHYRLMTFGERVDGKRPDNSHKPAEYRAAVMAIRGLTARRVAYYVCCEGGAAGQYGTRKRPGMEYLKEALDDLAAHFRV